MSIFTQLFQERKKPAPSVEEHGVPGTVFISGQLVEEEYNADLRGSKGLVVYDKMRRSDGQVKAVLLVCELPLRAATWDIEPASDESKDVEVAEFVKENLFEEMTITWDSFLKHILIMLWAGFMAFEKVWFVEGGMVKYRKLAPRLPKTIYSWDMDEHGGLKGVTQYAYRGSNYQMIPIPAEKLLIYTNEKEGSNFEGISILRAAYKHWYYKDQLYRIDAISAERHATGVPKFTHPSNAKDDDKSRLDEIGQRLYAHEQMYVRLADDYGFSIEGLTGSIRDIMPSIEHHDKMIARSVLAQFLNLGTSDVGSFALARDQSSFFLMALRSVGINICDTTNRYAIPQLVDYNYNVDHYPKLTVSGLETRNLKEYAEAITGLIREGALTKEPDLENDLRAMLKLPPKADDEPVEEPEPDKDPGPDTDDTGERKVFKSAEVPKRRRELTYAEGFVAFDEIEKVLDSGGDKFISATKDVMERQIDNLVEMAVKVIEKRQLGKVEDIQVRYQTQMADKMAGVLEDMFNYGRLQVKKEMGAQKHAEMAEVPGPLGDDEEMITEFLRTRTKASAGVMANKLKTAVSFEALRQIKAGVVDKAGLKSTLTDLSDKELIASARYSVAEAFNFGRSIEAEKEKEEIGRVQYSAIMDAHTCSSCGPLDGQEWDYDDPRTGKYASGNPECEGRELCRCVLIFIAKAETPARR